MKIIELHDERDTFWVNTDSIGMIETATITTRPSISKISSYIYVHGIGHYCTETVKEILQKIAEAEAERERKDGGYEMTHEIKILEDFAQAILNGDKTFEVRENDRGYQKGDRVRFIPVTGKVAPLTSVKIEPFEAVITYVLSGWGIRDGFVVFGIRLTNDYCSKGEKERMK